MAGTRAQTPAPAPHFLQSGRPGSRRSCSAACSQRLYARSARVSGGALPVPPPGQPPLGGGLPDRSRHPLPGGRAKPMLG